jgi:hypothetical protein
MRCLNEAARIVQPSRQRTKFDLLINLKTAKPPGLQVQLQLQQIASVADAFVRAKFAVMPGLVPGIHVLLFG